MPRIVYNVIQRNIRMKNKVLIICGPTAAGKTSVALRLTKEFSGEIISADSRQVYKGMNVVTGKDIPPDFTEYQSEIIWNGKSIPYYSNSHSRIWLTNLIYPNEPFNVAFWKECAELVIADIISRNRLPIIVGGTGLYIKALLNPLADIHIPPNPQLRNSLAKLSATNLFELLQVENPTKSASLSPSDRANPRRLIRYLEISRHKLPPLSFSPIYSSLQIGLSAPKQHLFQLINNRINERLENGALSEYQNLICHYEKSLPAFSTPGYIALAGANPVPYWFQLEKNYAKRQITWFLHQQNINWFDITKGGWYKSLFLMVADWYNETV